jgi:predicted Rossmann fold nucleotide-binding protein DprA/Smf involved in DNA uptake
MPVGRSGRIVVEFDPELKARLHARLRSEGRDFKGWLLERVEDYLGAPREKEEVTARLGEIESELTETQKRVLDALSADGPAQRHVDHLLDATGLPIGEIYAALLHLELQGHVTQDLGFYRRVRSS